MIVSFSGIDGSGKTTFARKAVEMLRAKGYKAWYSRPADIAISRLAGSALRRVSEKQARGAALSPSKWVALFRKASLLVDALLFRIFSLFAAAAGASLVCDRYFFDSVLHLKYLGVRTGWFEKLLFAIAPNPGIAFFLDVPMQDAVKRDKELSLGARTAARAFYKKKHALYSNFFAGRKAVRIQDQGIAFTAKQVEAALFPERPASVLALFTSFIRFKGDDSAWFDYLGLCTKKGPRYDVVAPHDRRGSKGFEEIDNLRIHRFQYFFPKGLQAIAYQGGVAHNLSRSLFAKIQFPFFMLSFFLKALRNVKGKDLMHAIFLPSTLTATVIKKLTGKPFVIWVQRMVFGSGLMRWLNVWVLRNCDHVFFNSSYTQAEALKVVTPKSHSILHMGVDLKRFRPMSKVAVRKKLGLPENGKIVLCLGRFVEKKGFEYLIQAMQLVKTPGVKLLVAGFGPLEGNLKRLVEESSLGGKVKFVGKVGNKAVPLWLNAADVFVVPSIVDSGGETETLGIVAVEGIACGRAVIASSVGGLVDVVKAGVSGFPVKQKSPSDIAEKIDLLFAKKGLIESIGRSARSYAEKNFSEQQAVEKTLEIYGQVLGR